MPALVGGSAAAPTIRRVGPPLALAAVVVLAAGCGRHHAAVFDVRKGMTKQQVRHLAGPPFRAGPRCWLYHATRSDEPAVDGMRFCFNSGRVSLVQTAVHG